MFSQSDKWEKWSDEQLWKAFREGRHKPLSEIFLRYYDRLYYYGMKLISDHAEVKDGIQQLFLRLWNKRESIDDAQSVEFYLLLSLRRILFRRQKQRNAIHRRNREYVEDFSSPSLTIEDVIICTEQKNQRNELFRKAFDTLTERQKEVLYLRLQHGLTNEEVAQVMNVSHQSVRNYIYEATQQLKDQIALALEANFKP